MDLRLRGELKATACGPPWIDDGWVIKISGVRSDGKIVTATNELRRVAKDRLRIESVDRIVGEERMPSFTAFAVRKPPAPQN